MISSVPSYDEELLNSAYANIGLIADKGWAFRQDDPFRKLNHKLWVQNCKLTARYRENGNYQPRCVHDTIPGSWLAQYGNYEYNEDRERMYKPGDNTPVAWQPNLHNGTITEPWMLEEVEEHFARLNSRAPLPLNNEPSTQLQSSVTGRTELSGTVTARERVRGVQPKWDAVLRKRYSTLEQVLASKNSNGKDSALCTSYTTNTDESRYKNMDPEDYVKYPPLRYTVDNMAEMQLQIRVTSDAVRDLWNPLKVQQQPQQQQQQKIFQYNHRHQQHLQCGRQQQHHLYSNKQPKYLQCTMQQQTLVMRSGRQTSCLESVGMMRQPPPPILSAEVPEFFPKGPMSHAKIRQEQTIPLQFFPSSAERSYQDELFPYNRGHIPGSGNAFQSASIPIQHVSNTCSLTRPSHQWIQRPSPPLHVQVPVCPLPHQSGCTSMQPACPTIIQRRIQIHDKLGGIMAPQSGLASTPIPVYQRPPELYNDPTQRRKNQGVDFNNLILLTKNAMKARRNQSKNPQQSSSLILEPRQPNLKSETDVLQWLEKGYPKKAKEYVAVNILASDFQTLEEKCDNGETILLKENTQDINREAKDVSPTALEKSPTQLSDPTDPSSDAPTKRRLYRDVLTNSSATGIVFDKRYDELERQAMEQYRTSEECLALRYQELERQAMEQYRNSDNGASSTSNSQNQTSSPVHPLAKEKPSDQSKSVTEDEECIRGQKCSGFGHCSPIKDPPSENEKGTPPRQPLTILRPESKPGTSTTHRVTNHNKCSRPAVVTKSLTTLNQRFSRDSKNTTRGASGDKIDRNVQTSPKRRLILMSPSERKSEARPTKTSGLETTYTFKSISTRVSGSYQRPEVIQTGGGDEEMTILRSPGAEGIRKQLFLANEELMDSSSESLGVRLLEPTEVAGPCMEMDKNLKEQIIGVSSRMSIAAIVNAANEDDEEHSISDICPTDSKQRQELKKISNRLTRNKKKQCKPHNVVTVDESMFHPRSSPQTNSLDFLPCEAEYGVEIVDILPQNKLRKSEFHRAIELPQFKLKLKSGYQKMCPIPHFPPTSFEKRNYLAATDCYSCSSIILAGAACYCVSLCNIANVDTSEIYIYNDSYLYPEQCAFETSKIYFRNKICSRHILTFQYCEVMRIENQEIRLLSPFQVSPLWNNSKVNDHRRNIAFEIAPRKIQTNNLSSTNDCTQFYPVALRSEALCKIRLNIVNLQIFPTTFVQVLVGEKNLHLYGKENIHDIMTDFKAMLPVNDFTNNVNINRKLEYF